MPHRHKEGRCSGSQGRSKFAALEDFGKDIESKLQCLLVIACHKKRHHVAETSDT
jgi:hypothetical protein